MCGTKSQSPPDWRLEEGCQAQLNGCELVLSAKRFRTRNQTSPPASPVLFSSGKVMRGKRCRSSRTHVSGRSRMPVHQANHSLPSGPIRCRGQARVRSFASPPPAVSFRPWPVPPVPRRSCRLSPVIDDGPPTVTSPGKNSGDRRICSETRRLRRPCRRREGTTKDTDSGSKPRRTQRELHSKLSKRIFFVNFVLFVVVACVEDQSSIRSINSL